uniref:Cytochrome b n=1 Tax=Tanystylum orbiculare TaxID=88027 RepID=E0XLF1_TANOR|nr:cytochrome b [Tanystylum orbiculare]ADB91996.1 cytochrome b [Tanystylum orbiculare]
MKNKIMKSHIILKHLNSMLVDLPAPSNINVMWSFGSMLGVCLIIQILSGLFLSMHYCPEVSISFSSISHIMRNVNNGWLLRTIHANGASMFFMLMYIHISRGMFFNSFYLKEVWLSGILILFLSMGTAFMGYVLPWGQMSFWGAAVITNLVSAIPYLGIDIVQWLWGGFSVNNATLNRFYTFHFILPMILSVLVIIHLIFLHIEGSNNPMGTSSNIDKVPFHPMFSSKDIIGFTMMLLILLMVSLINPMILNDPENFIPANSMVTPIHIQPEWYFLFAYAILWSIPNKLGGVVALILSILILLTLPFSMKMKIQSMKFFPLNKFMLWIFFVNIILLTWIGAKPVEMPFEAIGILLTIIHFMYFIVSPIIFMIWQKY